MTDGEEQSNSKKLPKGETLVRQGEWYYNVRTQALLKWNKKSSLINYRYRDTDYGEVSLLPQ